MSVPERYARPPQVPVRPLASVPSRSEESAAERDIDANRRGRLSRAQADLIKKQQRWTLLAYIGVPLLGIQIAIGVFSEAPRGGGVLAGLLYGAASIAVVAGTVLGSLLMWKRKDRLVHENVTAVDGWVAWTNVPLPWTAGHRAWAPIGPSGAPLPIAAGGPILPPGRWRFYLHDDRLVGAESPLDALACWSICQTSPLLFTLNGSSVPPPAPLPVEDAEALRRVLGQTLGFTPDDLHHHRCGSLPPRQGSGSVISIEGALTVGWRMAGKADVRYRWEIGGRTFEVPLAWLMAAPPDVRYRVYLDARSQRMLSLEPAPTLTASG